MYFSRVWRVIGPGCYSRFCWFWSWLNYNYWCICIWFDPEYRDGVRRWFWWGEYGMHEWSISWLCLVFFTSIFVFIFKFCFRIRRLWLLITPAMQCQTPKETIHWLLVMISFSPMSFWEAPQLRLVVWRDCLLIAMYAGNCVHASYYFATRSSPAYSHGQ